MVAETKKHHPKGDPSAAYREIYETLVSKHGFEWKQGSAHAKKRTAAGPPSPA